MKTIAYYLLQVILISGILYGYYHFFLRNKKFHLYNRYFLLAITFISILAPFIKIPVYFTSEEDIPVIYKVLAEVRVTTSNTTISNIAINWQKMLMAFYCVCVIFILTRLFISLNKLKGIIKKNKSIRFENLSLIDTNESGAPFSFFNWIFWNNRIALGSEKGKQVLQHEIYHVRQKHSLDIIFMEVLSALFWVNPFFFCIKKELRVIHEFSADQFALLNGSEYSYAELLLQSILQTQQQLVNPFFHNQIKRRIAMITNSSTTSRQYLRKTMVLPIAFIAISVIAVNCRAKDNYNDIDPNKVYEKVEVEASFPSGNEGWQTFLSSTLNANLPVDNGAPEGTYKTMIQFIVDENGNISDLKPLTAMGYGMEDEVIRMMKLSPKWITAQEHGKAVKSYRKQPVTFVIEAE